MSYMLDKQSLCAMRRHPLSLMSLKLKSIFKPLSVCENHTKTTIKTTPTTRRGKQNVLYSSVVSDGAGESRLALVCFHSASAEVGQQQHKTTESLITFTTQRTQRTHTHTRMH